MITNFQKSVFNLLFGLLFVSFLTLIACGGGKTVEQFDNADTDPDFGLNAEDSLAAQAENTLSVSIDSNPAYIDFGPVSQNKKVTQKIILTNNSGQSQTLQTSFNGAQSGYTLLNDEGLINVNQNITLASGESHQLTVQFTGSTLGRIIGSVIITAQNATGRILVPVGATVSLASNIKIISSQFLCSNKEAPSLDVIDFLRVASGRSLVKSFKICNNSANSLKINSLKFTSSTSTIQSKALEDPSIPDFFWNIDHVLEDAYFSYYNPQDLETFEEMQIVPYSGTIPLTYGAFSAVASNPNDSKNKTGTNQIIQPNSYLIVDVRFAPSINIEAPENQLYEPIPYSSLIEMNTTSGYLRLQTVGATGGREPQLRIVSSKYDAEPPACSSTQYNLDLGSNSTTLNFGEASIYEDWIPEDRNIIKLRLCNIGSGSKPLKIWGDPITKGYFTYVEDSTLDAWPIVIPVGSNKVMSIAYNPTPENTVTSESTDFGQLQLAHNASNGPYTAFTLLGTQQKSSAITITQGDSNLKKTYTADRPKNMQCLKIDGDSEKPFKIKNNSAQYQLVSNLSVSNLAIKDVSGNTVNKQITYQFSDGNNIVTNAGGNSLFDIIFSIPKGVPENSTVTGKLRILNTFQNAGQNNNSLTYDIEFKAKASKTGECAGGSGAPLDDAAVIIIDRITMNLVGGLTDPARNPPSFKFHLPVELNKNNKWAKISGLSYDPTDPETNNNPVKQIRSYAHQITDVTNKCTPLPTNPYRLEFEKGSWDGPDHQCDWKSEDETINVISNTACIANNGAQVYEVTDPQLAASLEVDVGSKVSVFYHEFAYFGNNCSSPDIEGKLATFVLKEGEKTADVFKKMVDKFGTSGSRDDYASITRVFQFDSYIKFNAPFDDKSGKCLHQAGDLVTDPNELETCWTRFANADVNAAYNFRRIDGFIEECSYFQFEIEEGCGPGDENSSDPTTKARCKDFKMNDKSTWKGFGEYEPDPDEDNAYNLTLRNVRIDAFTLVHSLNGFFPHEGRLLYSPLYVTLTTKAIGKGSGDSWKDLIANNARFDFNVSNVQLEPKDPNTKKYWIDSGVNGQFTVGENGDFDDRDCNLAGGILNHCRGNYEYFNNKLYHAGEPINYDQNGRMLMVGLAAFHGKGNLSPGFAKESNGKGQPLYFTFHACMKPGERDENGKVIDNLDSGAGCYGEKSALDQGLTPSGHSVVDDYVAAGVLTNKEVDDEDPSINRALINYKIFDEDRKRLTNYYKYPNHYKFDPDDSPQTGPCGIGN